MEREYFRSVWVFQLESRGKRQTSLTDQTRCDATISYQQFYPVSRSSRHDALTKEAHETHIQNTDRLPASLSEALQTCPSLSGLFNEPQQKNHRSSLRHGRSTSRSRHSGADRMEACPDLARRSGA